MEARTLDCFVIDAGAHTTRAGRAEDFPTDADSPHIVIPSRITTPADGKPQGDGEVVQVPRCHSQHLALHAIDEITELDVRLAAQVFDESGCVAHWEALESIYEYILYEQLGWPEGDEGYVMVTENLPCTPRSNRERLTQMLFETFNVKGCYLLDSSVACLYAAGKTDGIVVDIGHTGTNVVQVLALSCLSLMLPCLAGTKENDLFRR
jgi:actin-related protein